VEKRDGRFLKSKFTFQILALFFLSVLLGSGVLEAVPKVYAQRGAQIDRVLVQTRWPYDQVNALTNGQVDFLPDLASPADIERLRGMPDYNVMTARTSADMGYTSFDISYVGFNLRRPYLSDVSVRHALFHAYNQREVVSSIYKYTAQPLQSLVPPSQGDWMLPELRVTPEPWIHPFNPGNIGDAPGTESTFGIMYQAGYTYTGTGYGDLNGYWTRDGVPLPTWQFFTPTREEAPTYYEHGARITAEWNKCGFNNIIARSERLGLPLPLNAYLSRVFDEWNFDIFMMFSRVERFPLQLYSMCHSSQYVWGSSQPVGLNDPVLDGYVETVKYSLNRAEALEAAWEAQRRLYDPSNAQGLPYMMMHSSLYYSAASPGLLGNVNSPGYGVDNIWTWLNWRWSTPDNEVVYCNGNTPRTLNYLAQRTAYEDSILGLTHDTLIRFDPYQLRDIPWQADSWEMEGPVTLTTPGGVPVINGMKVTYNINPNVYWQDGNKFTASEAAFSISFVRQNMIPKYLSATQNIVEVYVNDADTFTVYASRTSPYYIYMWAEIATLCPSRVWAWLNGSPLRTILGYDLTLNATDTGPWSFPLTANGPKTVLFGTGPFVFDSYTPASMVADLHNWDSNGLNLGYFKLTQEISDLKTEMFYAAGDVDRSGAVWASDKWFFGVNFGKPASAYPDADLNLDGVIDWSDGAIIGAYFGYKKEYPSPLV
jgi:ABC-type transport system substrate-binding protein